MRIFALKTIEHHADMYFFSFVVVVVVDDDDVVVVVVDDVVVVVVVVVIGGGLCGCGCKVGRRALRENVHCGDFYKVRASV